MVELDKIKKLILNSGNYILELDKKNYISNNNLRDVSLFFLMNDLFKDKDIEKIFRKYFLVLKENIESIGVNEIGLISGSTFDLFVVYQFKQKYGGMENFYKKLESLIYKNAVNRSNNLINKNRVQPQDYDLIRGIAGVLYYYLITDSNLDLSELINYLIYLTEEKIYKSMKIMNIHIEFDSSEKDFIENGYINFSISHGMMSVLISLTLAKIKGYNLNGLENAIFKLLDTYSKFEKKIDKIHLWPTQLDIKSFYYGDWIFEKDPRMPNCMSWCYGSMSIHRGLSKVYKMIGNEKKYLEYKLKFNELLDRDLKMYYLHNPNICHGYGSVITEVLCLYTESNDKNIIKNIRSIVEVSLESYKDVNNKLEKKFNDGLDISIQDLDGTYKNFNFLNGCIGYYLSLNALISKNLEYSKLLMVDPYIVKNIEK